MTCVWIKSLVVFFFFFSYLHLITLSQLLVYIATTLHSVSLSRSVLEVSESNCHINCTWSGLPSNLGCAQLDVIDASKGNNITIDCESNNPYSGGCQLIQILCPLNGNCIIK